MPVSLRDSSTVEQAIHSFLTTIIDLTADHVCAYKIQKAFFDLHPEGKILLKQVISYIQQRVPYTPVIVDCKIGDIDNTMDAYLQAILVDLDADGVVLNPYMGLEVWSSLSAYPNKAGIVLVRTSNPGSYIIQEAKLSDGRTMWRYVLDLVISEWQKGATLIPVLSSNSTDELHELRTVIPDDMPIFLAGVGVQGGQINCIKYLTDSHGGGLMINSSRALLYPYEPNDDDWRKAVKRAAINMKNSINESRR
jgi:orotidine-5'-phosphate decarboxylase